MRVIQLVTKRQLRGAEVFAEELSIGLGSRGHTVYYAGLNPPPVTDAVAPANVVSDDVSDTAPSKLSIRLVRQLARYLRDRQPDLVQANGGYALKYAVLAKQWSRGRWPIIYRNIGLSSD
jgi:L-malate glycosyltransferase